MAHSAPRPNVALLSVVPSPGKGRARIRQTGALFRGANHQNVATILWIVGTKQHRAGECHPQTYVSDDRLSGTGCQVPWQGHFSTHHTSDRCLAERDATMRGTVRLWCPARGAKELPRVVSTGVGHFPELQLRSRTVQCFGDGPTGPALRHSVAQPRVVGARGRSEVYYLQRATGLTRFSFHF